MFKTFARLGKGAYGNVLAVQDTENLTVHALKQSNAEESGDVDLGALRELLFYNNYAASTSIASGRAWFDKNESPQMVYCLMEKYDLNLLQVMNRLHQTIHFDTWLWICEKLIDATTELHSRGWMHRDIKPENVYVRQGATTLELVVGDFNLVRFAAHDLGKQSTRRASVHVCTLYTRAPELVAAELKGSKLEYGYEVDWYSVGATLLAVAHGDYILGARHPGSGIPDEDEYLQTLFKFVGTDDDIKSRYATCESKFSFDTLSSRIWDLLPEAWTPDERRLAATWICRLVDPAPERRIANIPKVKADVSDMYATNALPNSKLRQLSVACVYSKPKSFPAHYIRKHETPTVLHLDKPHGDVHALWATLGSAGMPPELAAVAVLCRRNFPEELCGNPRMPFALMFCLRALHYFPYNGRVETENHLADFYAVAPYVTLSKDLWDFAAQLLLEPFLFCVLCAWVYVYGKLPPTKQVLSESSPELRAVLFDPAVEPLFGAFGYHYKSQKALLESWKRLEAV